MENLCQDRILNDQFGHRWTEYFFHFSNGLLVLTNCVFLTKKHLSLISLSFFKWNRSGVKYCRRFLTQNLPGCVGFIEETDHTQQDRPNILNVVNWLILSQASPLLSHLSWIPSLAGQLSGLGVVHWRVEDGDTEVAILVDVGVPDFRKES